MRQVVTCRKLTLAIFQSREGNVAPIFAMALFAIMCLVGLSIDLSRTQSAKEQLQLAADATALAATQEYIALADADPAERKKQVAAIAQSYFNANLHGAGGLLSDATINLSFPDDRKSDWQSRKDAADKAGEDFSDPPPDDDLVATANANINMAFGGLIGKDSVHVGARAGAAAAVGQRLEIVLSLDNSLSMFREKRMTKMREATIKFTQNLFEKTNGANQVQIGIVPWAQQVNINSEQPGEWAPMNAGGSKSNDDEACEGKPDDEKCDPSNPENDSGDTQIETAPMGGSKAVPPKPFENRLKYLYEPTDDVPYTQAQMDRDFGPVGWRGCINAAPGEREVSSDGKVKKTLTDQPPSPMRWHAGLIKPNMPKAHFSYSGTKTSGSGCDDLYSPNDPTCQPNIDYVPPSVGQCKGSGCDMYSCDQSAWAKDPWTYNPWVPSTIACVTSKAAMSSVEACVSDPNEFEYNQNGGKACPWMPVQQWDDMGNSNNDWEEAYGPNLLCPSAMLGMSSDEKQIIDKLQHLYPVHGGTSADLGLMWGLRMMSPDADWTKFFGYSETLKPRGYDDPGSRKIMILLSDGQNDAAYIREGYWGCTYGGGGRGYAGPCWKPEGVSGLDDEMIDALMLDACDVIREDYDIELYTIAVDMDSKSRGVKVLSKCAGDDEHFFNIKSSELSTTFDILVTQSLRLTQ